MLTKKYYRMIADCISASDCESDLINRLCREFRIDNSNFNEDKFREACHGGNIAVL